MCQSNQMSQLPAYLKGAVKSWYAVLKIKDQMDYKTLKAKSLMAFKGLQTPVQFLNEMQKKKQQKGEAACMIY